MTTQAVTERPSPLDALDPQPTRQAADRLASARGAMIGAAIALFPWSLVILLLAWLF